MYNAKTSVTLKKSSSNIVFSYFSTRDTITIIFKDQRLAMLRFHDLLYFHHFP